MKTHKTFLYLFFLVSILSLCLLFHKNFDTFGAFYIPQASASSASPDSKDNTCGTSHTGNSDNNVVSRASVSNATPSNPKPPEPSSKVVTSLLNLPTMTQPWLIETNDWERFEYFLSYFHGDPYVYIFGRTADHENVVLKVEDVDYEGVDLTKTGTYTVTVTFAVDERYSPGYILPDELKTHSILINVYDQENFLIFYGGRFTKYLNIVWGFSVPSSSLSELWYIESKAPLSSEDLEDMDWKFWDNGNSVYCQMELQQMHINHHYYVQVRQQEYVSNILHIVYDGTTVTGEGIGGQRDEGGRGETPKPPVIVAPPDIPPSSAAEEPEESDTPSKSENADNTPGKTSKPGNSENTGIVPGETSKPANFGNNGSIPEETDKSANSGNAQTAENTEANANANNTDTHTNTETAANTETNGNAENNKNNLETAAETAAVTETIEDSNHTASVLPIITEEDTEDYTIFSGRRLLYMRSSQNSKFLRLKKHHIVIDIPWNWTYFDTLKDSSSLKVLLLSDTAERFTLSILTDGKTPDTFPEVSVYLPWDSDYSSDLSLQNLDTGNVFPVQYLAESKELCANISEGGIFVLNNQTHSCDGIHIKCMPRTFIIICISILALILCAGGICLWKHTGKKEGNH